ncbi:unnamed protein product, partial [Closterium sp. Naga37s-1]
GAREQLWATGHGGCNIYCPPEASLGRLQQHRACCSRWRQKHSAPALCLQLPLTPLTRSYAACSNCCGSSMS